MLEQGCAKPQAMLIAAAKGGHADTCEQLLAAGCPWSVVAAGKAAAGGHVTLMQRLVQLSEEQPGLRPTYIKALLCGAAKGLNLAIFQSLHAQYVPQIAAAEAAAVGTRVRGGGRRWATLKTTSRRLSGCWTRAISPDPSRLGMWTAMYLMPGKRDEPEALTHT